MKIGRFWLLMIGACLVALGMAWQSSRFADLAARADSLEREQAAWMAENRRIEAEIAQLSSRERIETQAQRLGLKKAQPEDILRVILAPAGKTEAGND
ncbi:MAG: septum formation initiator family protein [Spirochaetia bacterium]|nr:septum formation initiator family protein [Spirochaetales bacterium]MDX9783928.1 septum formation initiator family protein [Spirochaetia bacterium]